VRKIKEVSCAGEKRVKPLRKPLDPDVVRGKKVGSRIGTRQKAHKERTERRKDKKRLQS